MSLMRSLGRFSSKMSGNKEFMSGVMEGIDPHVVGQVINENADFLGKITPYLDPKAIADSMGDALGFYGEVIKYIDPSAVAEAINKNERLIPRFIECIDPNVFTRSSGAVFTKMRQATYRPPMFQQNPTSPSEETDTQDNT